MAVTIKSDGAVLLEGVVLACREQNWHDDSDFYVIYWNEAHQNVSEYEYGSTRYGGTDGNSACVDASEEIRAKADEWEVASALTKLRDQNEPQSHYIEVGKEMRITGGRKVPIGTVGLCFWEGETQYGWRVGLALDEERNESNQYKNVVWANALDHVEVHKPEQYLKTEDELIELAEGARRWVSRKRWIKVLQ